MKKDDRAIDYESNKFLLKADNYLTCRVHENF